MATALIAVCMVPAMDALQTGILGAAVHESLTLGHYALQGKLEGVLAEPFGNLDAAAQGPQPVAAYSASPLDVYISRYDGDGDSVPDPDLLLVRVEHNNTGQSLQTLTSQ